MPIAFIPEGLYFLVAFNFSIAWMVYFHQLSGDCSAQPVCSEIISASISGYWAEAIHTVVAASTTDTFIDDVPISIPSRSSGPFPELSLLGDIIVSFTIIKI